MVFKRWQTLRCNDQAKRQAFDTGAFIKNDIKALPPEVRVSVGSNPSDSLDELAKTVDIAISFNGPCIHQQLVQPVFAIHAFTNRNSSKEKVCFITFVSQEL